MNDKVTALDFVQFMKNIKRTFSNLRKLPLSGITSNINRLCINICALDYLQKAKNKNSGNDRDVQ